MAEQDPQDFSLFQLVADQLISIVGAELGNGAGPIALGRKLVISDRETNDIHVDPTTIYLNPHYFVSHDQRKIIQGVFALSVEFDSERHKRTLRAINQLSWDLRIAMKRLGELDPKALDIIIREEYLGEPSSEPIHLSIVETEDEVMTLEEWCRTPEALERQQRNEDALARAKARPQEIEEDEG